jgi:hypothetical protein
MKINQVHQVGDYAAGVSKVTTVSRTGGVSQDIRWTLPKLMFEELGGPSDRSVAASFIPLTRQGTNPIAVIHSATA